MKNKFLKLFSNLFRRKQKRIKKDETFDHLEYISANNFDDIIGKYLSFNSAKVSKDFKEVNLLVPRILYGWIDPDSPMGVDRGWFLLGVDNFLLEFSFERLEGSDPEIEQIGQEPMSVAQLKEKIVCGDFNEMINIETDKTVNDELEELFKNLK